MRLKKGERKTLADMGLGHKLHIDVDYGMAGVDICAFSLVAGDVIGDDRYVILFSNPSSPEGAIRMTEGLLTTAFDLDLALIPTGIAKIVLTATHDNMEISKTGPLVVTLDDRISFDVIAAIESERAVKAMEIYRHQTGWRICAVGQGFNGGLPDLIGNFGGTTS